MKRTNHINTRINEEKYHQLEAKNNYYDNLFNFMPNYMLLVNSNFDVMKCNQKFANLLNIKLSAIIGKNLQAFSLGGIKEKLAANDIWREEHDALHGSFEWLHIDENNVNRFIVWHCSKAENIKHIEDHYILIGADISTVKESQQEMLKLKEKAEAANQAKSTFLATMSHEIRTPLNGVIGMVELLAQVQTDTRSQEMIETISLSASHLLSIINDILDFSKIESGSFELEAEPFDLIQVLNEIAVAFRLSAHKNKISLYFTIDPQVTSLLIGDSVRFKQILTNLISNALKFTFSETPWQGFIHLKVELFDAEPGKVGLVFRVEDNGIGIELEKLKSIFQPFEQAESSTTRKFGGTGLGLSITSKLSQAMGGDIWVLSQKNKGTEFTCYLPFSLPKQALQLESEANGYFDASLKGKKSVVFTRNQFVYQELKSAICGFNGSLDWPENLVDVADYQYIFVFEEQLEIFSELVQQHGDKVILLTTSLGTLKPSKFTHLPCCQVLPLDFQQLKLLFNKQVKANISPDENLILNQNAKVLLAEDYEINRKVILAQLATLGIKADVAENGAIAWQMLQCKHYDLLLTDCHMPVMDGYLLSKTIRQANTAELDKLIIIAITANAMKGEREVCLSAGMNDYIAKPIKLITLKEMLISYLGCQQGNLQGPIITKALEVTPSNSQSYFDVEQLKQIIGDDEELSNELLQDYIDISQQALTELEQACLSGDLIALTSIAHKLKSPSKSIGAEIAFNLCQKIETYGKQEQLLAITPLLAELAPTMTIIHQQIKHYLAQQAEGLPLTTSDADSSSISNHDQQGC